MFNARNDFSLLLILHNIDTGTKKLSLRERSLSQVENLQIRVCLWDGKMQTCPRAALRSCDNVKVWSTYYILSPVYINKLGGGGVQGQG